MASRDLILRRCSAAYAGILADAGLRPAIMYVGGMDALSVTLSLIGGTLSTATVNVRWGAEPGGPFRDYSSPVSITDAAGSGLLAVIAPYACVEATAGEGGESFVDIHMHAHTTNNGIALIT